MRSLPTVYAGGVPYQSTGSQAQRAHPVLPTEHAVYPEGARSRRAGRAPGWNPCGVREPQWLGLSLPKKKRRGEEGRATCSTETYLCGSAPVQNSLLAPRHFAGVSSQGGATGGSGEGTVTKGPGRETPGDSSFGRRGAPSTALSRKRRGSSCGSSRGRACGYRPRTTWVLPAAAWRKGSETMTGEVPRRPTVGKPHR